MICPCYLTMIRVYLVHGGGDIQLVELNENATGFKPGGLNQVIIRDASSVAGRNVGFRLKVLIFIRLMVNIIYF